MPDTDPDTQQPADPPDGSDLCLQCGLCCSGALFSRAPLAAEEAERCYSLGLSRYEHRGAPWFGLPCTRLDGTRCTIYEGRPAVCRTFRCRVLRRFEDGRIGRDAALEAIATARNLLDRAARHGPEARLAEFRRQALRDAEAALRPDAPPEARRQAGQMLLDCLAADEFLDAEFRLRKSAQKMGDADAA